MFILKSYKSRNLKPSSLNSSLLAFPHFSSLQLELIFLYASPPPPPLLKVLLPPPVLLILNQNKDQIGHGGGQGQGRVVCLS